MVTNGQDGLKGSARSIPEYHIYDAMTEVKDVFCKYGGHAMAAGFSLNDGMLDKFRRDINEKCKLTEEDLTEKILIDVPMPMEYVTDKLIEQLELLEPFGNGNAKGIEPIQDFPYTKVVEWNTGLDRENCMTFYLDDKTKSSFPTYSTFAADRILRKKMPEKDSKEIERRKSAELTKNSRLYKKLFGKKKNKDKTKKGN